MITKAYIKEGDKYIHGTKGEIEVVDVTGPIITYKEINNSPLYATHIDGFRKICSSYRSPKQRLWTEVSNFVYRRLHLIPTSPLVDRKSIRLTKKINKLTQELKEHTLKVYRNESNR